MRTPLLDSARVYMHPRLSPDGRRVAFEAQAGSSNEVWIADLAGQTAQRMTREGFSDRPEWTPDGRRVMYVAAPKPANSLWWQPADGSGTAELVYQGHGRDPGRGLHAGRQDGRLPDGHAGQQPGHLPPAARPGSGSRCRCSTSIDDDKQPRVSPDWEVAGVRVQPVGTRGGVRAAARRRGARVAISTGGGGEPLWAPDGTRLYYRSGLWLLAARVVTTPSFAVTPATRSSRGPTPPIPFTQTTTSLPTGGASSWSGRSNRIGS